MLYWNYKNVPIIAMNSEITNAIQEWVDIQNITIDKQFYKPYLEQLKNGDIDVCNALTLDICSYQVGCDIYKNQCINKTRLKPMHYTGNTLLSSKHKIPFEIVDSGYLTTIYLLINEFSLYYVTVRSVLTGNIYVLFSSGIVLTKTDLYENKELKDSIMLLIGNITYLSKQNNQIFLCGHSMGSVLAMYTGYLMYTGKSQFKHAFLNNCYIFGSASAKWMLNESVWKSKQSNIYQFISCELRVNKTKKRLLVDCYQLEGDNEFILYPYFYYIFTENENNFMIESDSNKMNDYSIEYTAKNSQQCQKLHRWAFYVSLLQKQNSLPQNIDLNSNNKSVSRSKTYSVYRNRKKISNMSKTRNNRE